MSRRMTWPELTSRAHATVTRARAIAIAAAAAVLHSIDAREVHFYGGLVVAGYGGWRVSPAWTLIVVGAVLTRVGLRGPR